MINENLIYDIFEAPDYFSFFELIHTDTGLSNVPYNMSDLRRLAICSHVLNYIRHKSEFAIRINSGFRSDDVNRVVGGVPNSYHRRGHAFDISPLYKDLTRYKTIAKIVEFSPLRTYLLEVIPYDDKHFVHISINVDKLLYDLLYVVNHTENPCAFKSLILKYS